MKNDHYCHAIIGEDSIRLTCRKKVFQHCPEPSLLSFTEPREISPAFILLPTVPDYSSACLKDPRENTTGNREISEATGLPVHRVKILNIKIYPKVHIILRSNLL